MSEITSEPVAADEVLQLIERVERLTEEKQGFADDIKDVWAEAKSRGFDVKTMKRMQKLRKLEKQARDEQDALDEIYRQALKLD